MYELVTRAVEEDRASVLAEVPVELMRPEEKDVVAFVLQYVGEFGKPPSLRRLMEKFESFIPFKFMASTWEEEPAPIEDVAQLTIKRKLVDISRVKLNEALRIIEAEGACPLDVLSEVERIHTMAEGVHAYSTFDRDAYFRRDTLALPFTLINNHIGGIAGGDFMLLVGRLGTGKSTIAQHITKSLWERGRTVLYVSAEMPGADVFSRIDAMVGKFNPLALRSGATTAMKEMLGRVLAKVSDEPGEVIIPKSRLISPQQIGAFAKNLMVDLIIVDGAYLLQPNDGVRITSKWEKVSTVSNELKQMALDLGIPIIATAQIKRGVSAAEEYTPEDIALSDALGQDADFVIAMKQNPVMKERLELQLIKNRYGSNCATQVAIDWDAMTVIDETIEGSMDEEAEKETWRAWAGMD
jgi:archaellum biogenesis ATPase FlaH